MKVMLLFTMLVLYVRSLEWRNSPCWKPLLFSFQDQLIIQIPLRFLITQIRWTSTTQYPKHKAHLHHGTFHLSHIMGYYWGVISSQESAFDESKLPAEPVRKAIWPRYGNQEKYEYVEGY